MRKILYMNLIIALALLSLTGCQSESEEVSEEVPEEVEEENPEIFTITDNTVSSVYDNLMDIYYTTNTGETGIMVVPMGYNYQDHLFDNSFESDSKMTYKFSVEEKDFNEYLDFMEEYCNSDSMVVSLDLIRMLEYGQIKAEFDNGLTEYIFAMETHGLMISFVLDYKLDEITTHELDILKDLKDAYVLDLMDLPDEIIVEPEELDEEYDEEYYNEFEEKYNEFMPEDEESTETEITEVPTFEEFEESRLENTTEEGENND